MNAKTAASFIDEYLSFERKENLGENNPGPDAFLTWEEKQHLNTLSPSVFSSFSSDPTSSSSSPFSCSFVGGTCRRPLTDIMVFGEGWFVDVFDDIAQSVPKMELAEVCRKHQVFIFQKSDSFILFFFCFLLLFLFFFFC